MNASLNRGWAIDSVAQTKRVPSLAAGGAHAQIGGDGFAVPDPAGDEHRHLAQMRQDLLGEHAGRDRPDVPARLHAFDDQRVGAGAHQALGHGEAGGEAEQPGAAVLDPRDGRAIGQPAGQDDVAHPLRAADVDQRQRACGCMMIRLTPNGRAVSPWVSRDLGGQLIRRHGAAGDHAEAAGVRERRDQAVLRHPGHRAAHQGEVAAEKARCPRATGAPGAAARARSAPQAASRP